MIKELIKVKEEKIEYEDNFRMMMYINILNMKIVLLMRKKKKKKKRQEGKEVKEK